MDAAEIKFVQNTNKTVLLTFPAQNPLQTVSLRPASIENQQDRRMLQNKLPGKNRFGINF